MIKKIFIALSFYGCLFASDLSKSECVDLMVSKIKSGTNNSWIFYENNCINYLDKDIKYYMGMTIKPNKESLGYHLDEVLSGGGSSFINQDKKYAVLNAFRHQSAIEKGFIWIDYKNKKMIAAIRHFMIDETPYNGSGFLFIFTNDYTYDEFPQAFSLELMSWMEKKFVDYKGEAKLPTEIRIIDSTNNLMLEKF